MNNDATELVVLPDKLFLHQSPDGSADFCCHVRYPDGWIHSDLPTVIHWQVEDTTGSLRRNGVDVVSPDSTYDGLIPISVTFPSARRCMLTVQITHRDTTALATRLVSCADQTERFDLPFSGTALVSVGHGLNDVHRSSKAIRSQQFAWDFVPLSNDGLAVLNGPTDASPPAIRFCGYGTAVTAPAEGVVIELVDHEEDNPVTNQLPNRVPFLNHLKRAAGNYVVIQHQGVYSCLAHLMRESIQVSIGSRLSRGQPFARVGNSGFSSGPHLHMHFMDGPDMLTANPVPVRLHIEGTEFDPATGSFVTGKSSSDLGSVEENRLRNGE